MRDRNVSRLIVLCALLATIGASLRGAQTVCVHYRLDIPRESLDAALRAFAYQTGLQIARFSDMGNGDSFVGPVFGSLTSEWALRLLLANTGLGYRMLNNGVVVIVKQEDVPDADGAGHHSGASVRRQRKAGERG